jgi:hypothetical protein
VAHADQIMANQES